MLREGERERGGWKEELFRMQGKSGTGTCHLSLLSSRVHGIAVSWKVGLHNALSFWVPQRTADNSSRNLQVFFHLKWPLIRYYELLKNSLENLSSICSYPCCPIFYNCLYYSRKCCFFLLKNTNFDYTNMIFKNVIILFVVCAVFRNLGKAGNKKKNKRSAASGLWRFCLYLFLFNRQLFSKSYFTIICISWNNKSLNPVLVQANTCTSYISLISLGISADSCTGAGRENLPSQPANKLTAINRVQILHVLFS